MTAFATPEATETAVLAALPIFATAGLIPVVVTIHVEMTGTVARARAEERQTIANIKSSELIRLSMIKNMACGLLPVAPMFCIEVIRVSMRF